MSKDISIILLIPLGKLGVAIDQKEQVQVQYIMTPTSPSGIADKLRRGSSLLTKKIQDTTREAKLEVAEFFFF